MLRIQLGNYDSKYAKGLIETVPPADIVQALVGLLQKKGIQSYYDTCGLIRDLVLGPFESKKNEVFNRILDKSKVIPILERNILAGNHFESSASIYTLGKICSKQSVPKMLRSLKGLALRDPVNASDLVSEIWWLDGGGKKNWGLIDNLSKMGFWQKWGALHVLSHWSGQRSFEKTKMEYLKWFATDENAIIRLEATYLIEEKKTKHKPFDAELISPTIPKWEPPIQFDDIRLGIGNWIRNKKRTKVSIQDLNGLLDSKLKRKREIDS